MKNIVPFIVGPTAVGKTKLSLLLAEKLDLEIISADSRQIYRYMDIGTAKVPAHIRQSIPHHFIDICNPDEYYSAGQFSREARRVIKILQNKEKTALVAGGSGLYIKALIEGFFAGNVKNASIRRQLQDECLHDGLGSLYQRLRECDPDYADKLSPNDKQRILRALEVYLISGLPFSRWLTKAKQPADFEARIFGLRMERPELYARINKRVDEMLAGGLVAEAEQLLERGYAKDLNALNTVGYKEVFQYLDKLLDFAEMAEFIKRNSRRYAKRQMTWFKKEQAVRWFSVRSEKDLLRARDEIIESLAN